mmetsp:Transcript_29512/g.53734  ORF Transcript_29512/g.53734 Transcript_29512/m.53734 type:complete len:487 (+) Transcript_29512:60-1520(+)
MNWEDNDVIIEYWPGMGPTLGARLWDSGLAMMKFLDWSETQGYWSVKDLEVLELGSGTGLVGVKMAALGARVTLTDNQTQSLWLSQQNIERNKLQERASVELLDWLNPVTYLVGAPPGSTFRPPNEAVHFDLIVAADCLYDVTAERPLATTLAAHVIEGSQTKVLVAFKRRKDLSTGKGFFEMLSNLGFHIQRLEDAEGQAVGGKFNVSSYTGGRMVSLPADAGNAGSAVENARLHPEGDGVQIFLLRRPLRLYSVIGSWCDWKEWSELRRSGSAVGRRTIQVTGGELVEFQVGIECDWHQVLYPLKADDGETVCAGPGTAHGINWKMQVPDGVKLCEVCIDANAVPRCRIYWEFLEDPPVWMVATDLARGAVLVRSACELTSSVVGQLSQGARVEEVQLEGNRMQYRKLEGEGPEEGWVTLTVKGKDLLRRELKPSEADAEELDRLSAEAKITMRNSKLESEMAAVHKQNVAMAAKVGKTMSPFL